MRALGVLPLLLCAAVCVCSRFLSDSDMDVPGLPTGEQSSLERLTRSIPGSEFSRRDMNNVLTSVCCQVGCRKSDLTFLC
ncbi:hypothetical protein KUCAC02_023279 [Chaenocephalus aceratus]|uniref:Uncharacterized protein n=1 Tax=Chaenocephalus aceratus TaxID=36190 RepID=A0ACB9XRS1_CHAAC|nr:hypothetical protein KUCAC02_023279 [Chaenocephalus aceratus]